MYIINRNTIYEEFGKTILVIGISGSGNSGNVLKAIEYANENEGKTVGLCGYSGGKLYGEDIHMIVVHMMMQRLLEELRIWGLRSADYAD